MSEKNQLQEYCQKNKLVLPTYDTTAEGPPHSRIFYGTVTVAGTQYSSVKEATSKKEAERLAAVQALSQLLRTADSPTQSTKHSIEAPPISSAIYVQKLQEYCQKMREPPPLFNIYMTPESLPHAPQFIGDVTIKYMSQEKKFSIDKSTSTKKEMQQLLAQLVLNFLSNETLKTTEANNKSRSTQVIKYDDSGTLPSTKSKPRNYQIELYSASMTQNIICCLPTGAGKTLIGCMVISRMKELNPNKKILFLVDRIPLVFQQAEMIEKETSLTCLKCCGDTFAKSKLEQKYDVMVAIASLVINIIEKQWLSLQEFSLVVIDEAHHTTKEHPFSVILRNYYKNIPQEFKPKVLGLTAAPAVELDIFGTFIKLKVLARTIEGKAIMPTKYASELEEYVTNKSVDIITMPVNNEEHFIKEFLDYCKVFEEEEMSKNSTKQEEEKIEGEEIIFQASGIVGIAELTAQVQQLLTDIEVFGEKEQPKDIPTYLQGIVSNAQGIDDYKSRLLQWFKKQDLKKNIDPMHAVMSKGQKLVEVLDSYEKDKNFRGIIFVQTRESAQKLYRFLSDYHNHANHFVCPAVVTGHSNKGDDGMTVRQQQAAINQFREGTANLLVATSVVEEGFNVAECNVVIRLDAPSTVTALIQSRGRLRNKESRFIAIVKEHDSKDARKYEELQKQEKNLHIAVNCLLTGAPPSPEDLKEDHQPPKTYVQEIEEMVQKSNANAYPVKLEWVERQLTPPFIILLRINGRPIVEGQGPSKQGAKEIAAGHAFSKGRIFQLLYQL